MCVLEGKLKLLRNGMFGLLKLPAIAWNSIPFCVNSEGFIDRLFSAMMQVKNTGVGSKVR